MSDAAIQKMVDLFSQIEEDVEGIRVFAQPGGCSGMSFGMTFSETVDENDFVQDNSGIKVIVGSDTIEHLRGADIDFVDRGDGQQTFVFNNIPAAADAGCNTCGSAAPGGGCA